MVLSQSSEAEPHPTHDRKIGHIWLSRPQKGSKFIWVGLVRVHLAALGQRIYEVVFKVFK